MDKKIMLTLLLNQCEIMDAISQLTIIEGLKSINTPNAGKMVNLAEKLVRRSNETKDLLDKCLKSS